MRDTRQPRRLVSRLRWIHLAPLLAVLTLGAWAFASPIGASPDDDYHLVSVWCAAGGSEACQPSNRDDFRRMSTAFDSVRCYAMLSKQSAACLNEAELALDGATFRTSRGNFQNKYPGAYYGTMHVFAGDNLLRNAMAMRFFNIALFVGLATALSALLHASRRQTLLWGWLVSLIPLGVFLIPSNNPSGWTVTGVGTAYLALLGWFETEGKRRWALGALYVVGIVMAAGSRSDGAIFAAGATVVAVLLTACRTREWLRSTVLALAGLAIAAAFFLTTSQTDVGVEGFTGPTPLPVPGAVAPVVEPVAGFALAAQNLLMLPHLWTGVWGTWGLGWFDTVMPAIVPWAAVAAFIVVAFAGLSILGKRKAAALVGVVTVLTAMPVYLLTAGGDVVGDEFQPRYILPLIVLLALLVTTVPSRARNIRFTRVQALAILGALALANLVSLQVNIRRYVTGTDQQGVNLDSGAEWWWHGLPVGPMGVWLVGSLAFVGLLAVLWPELRRKTVAP